MKKVFAIAAAVALLSLASFSARSDVIMNYGEGGRIDAWCNYVLINQTGVGEIKFTSGETEKDSKLEIIRKDEGVDVEIVYGKKTHTLTIKKNKKVLIVVKFTKDANGSDISVISQNGGSISITCGK